jgi:hypothetical protein
MLCYCSLDQIELTFAEKVRNLLCNTLCKDLRVILSPPRRLQRIVANAEDVLKMCQKGVPKRKDAGG